MRLLNLSYPALIKYVDRYPALIKYVDRYPTLIKYVYIKKTRGSQEPVIAHLVFNVTSKVDRKWGYYT